MRASGFDVTVSDMPDVSPVKDKQGVPSALRSCHTAVVGGYAIEGHVPVDLVKKLLKEKPAAAGIAVPGMPMGSPGMEGDRKDAYNVVMFDKAGKTTVYAARERGPLAASSSAARPGLRGIADTRVQGRYNTPPDRRRRGPRPPW
jgi:hypothetical protein